MEVQCATGTAGRFTLLEAHALPGYALLSNLSNFHTSGSAPDTFISPLPVPNSTTLDGAPRHDSAVGVGVGVPLGLIVLVSLAWAFFGRRRVHVTSAKLVAVINGGIKPIPPEGGYEMYRENHHRPVELGAMHSTLAELEQTRSVPELMGRAR